VQRNPFSKHLLDAHPTANHSHNANGGASFLEFSKCFVPLFYPQIYFGTHFADTHIEISFNHSAFIGNIESDFY
jgi:hypothetical protein